jgi:hypothetical protein
MDSLLIWVLIEEGWRFVLDEEGVLIAYLSPSIKDRLKV